MVASLLLASADVPPGYAFDPARLVPHGRYADLETHRLYYDCQGKRGPVVLIDYGIGGSTLAWRDIQRELAADTTVCTYDRAGYGWSDPGPAPRTARQAAEELRALADAAGLIPPFILLGHSFGGFDTRIFAASHPADVVGLVWLDAAHPAEPLRSGGPAPGSAIRNPFGTATLPQAETDDAVAAYLNTRRKAVFAQMDELAHFDESARQALDAGVLPAVPLIVIARGVGRAASPPEDEQRWHRHQAELARLSPQGKLWIAEHSGHEIHHDRPDLVVAAVREVLEKTRAGSPPTAHAAAQP